MSNDLASVTANAGEEFPTLLSPLALGGLTIRNRVMMGSMHSGFEDRLAHMDRLTAYLQARSRGGCGLIITGGYAPNVEGQLSPAGSMMASKRAADKHRPMTEAIQSDGAAIFMQILHAGRYGFHPLVRSASTTKSPISMFKARGLSHTGVERTISAFVNSAKLAHRAGYNGVEIMGSEGYLINQFLAARTNTREDKWGGSANNRMRLPVEIVTRIRQELPENFAIQYRISLLDLVDQGQSWEEILELAAKLEQAGVSLFNTGIGWHESQIPTIATSVPRGAFTHLTHEFAHKVSTPVCASNRINDPAVAEQILQDGTIAMVSMARALLADPEFVHKAKARSAHKINTCIACNQACLDHVFAGKKLSCMVNPAAGNELTLTYPPHARAKKVAVVGAGVAGLACARTLAVRGHHVELFEAAAHVGGQFRWAMQIPGKEEFAHTLRYFTTELEELKVPIHTTTVVQGWELDDYDEIVIATGVTPRQLILAGKDHPLVVSYEELLSGKVQPADTTIIIGSGGIAVDVAQYLTLTSHSTNTDAFQKHWGIEHPHNTRAGLGEPAQQQPGREVHMFQRSRGKMGAGPGKTTGWIHRIELQRAGVNFHEGVTYQQIDDAGLHYTDKDGVARVQAAGMIVVCAGSISNDLLVQDFADFEGTVHVIGGASEAGELDAQRAIAHGVKIGHAI